MLLYYTFFSTQIFLEMTVGNTIYLASVYLDIYSIILWEIPIFSTHTHTKCLRLICTFPVVVLKSVISLGTPGSFKQEIISRKQDLISQVTHCFWSVIAFWAILEYITGKSTHTISLICTSIFNYTSYEFISMPSIQLNFTELVLYYSLQFFWYVGPLLLHQVL